MSRRIIAGALVALALFSILDLGMRKQTNMECQRGDAVPCFEHSSWLTAAIEGEWE